ncbi:MAG TPA: YebC/PmpR family DNA-binding transcriptional regulator [Kofleriaceae bacterium]|jgi:YebC/PmpR family DNA-binding regulatory protein
MGAQWKTRGKLATSSAKGKIFGKLSKELILAAKGGADPLMNAKLRTVLEAAKKVSMPKDAIDRAIKKGSGQFDDGTTLETVTYEGFGPHRVPLIVECLTDNKNRTTTTIRVLFRKGQLSPVAWDFSNVGLLDAAPPEGTDTSTAEEVAIESGAQDLELDPEGDGGVRFYTEPTDLDAVSKALASAGWSISGMRIGWRPKNPVKIDDPTARAEVEAFLREIDEEDDVQHMYVGYL